MTTKRFLSTNLLLMSLPLTLICSPATYADERSSDFHAETSPGDSTITLYGDQYERLDPAAGAGPGSSGGSGSGSSGGSSGVVVSFSVSKPGKTPLVCVAYAPDPNHLFCRPYEPEEPEEPAPAVVPVVVSARDVASLMVDGSGITRQPPGATARVDMDLIAYTDPSTRSLSTTVAGTLVEVEATPAHNKHRSHDEQAPFSRPTSTVLTRGTRQHTSGQPHPTARTHRGTPPPVLTDAPPTRSTEPDEPPAP